MRHFSEKLIRSKGILLSALFAGILAASSTLAAEGATSVAGSRSLSVQQGKQRTKILITIGTTRMTAMLEDNPTAQDFASLLPLTLTLREFGAAEKISGALPRPLSEQGAPTTDAGAAGDIAYYAPWRNIAFYRGQGPNASGVVRIARIISGIEALQEPGQVPVTITRAN